MAHEKILLIEDETDIQELVRYNLEKAGFRVTGATSGETGLASLKKDRPDVILLDLMLPGIDGLEVCRLIKGSEETRGIPVLILTAKGEETDIVTGLELGADDYITKPFSPKVLAARVRAACRRKKEVPADSVVTVHGIVIDPTRREIRVEDAPIDVTFMEFEILRFLAQRPGWVFTRYQIVDAVRGENYPVTDRSVDVHIVGLRKKLGASGAYIETVRGIGYRMKEPE